MLSEVETEFLPRPLDIAFGDDIRISPFHLSDVVADGLHGRIEEGIGDFNLRLDVGALQLAIQRLVVLLEHFGEAGLVELHI